MHRGDASFVPGRDSNIVITQFPQRQNAGLLSADEEDAKHVQRFKRWGHCVIKILSPAGTTGAPSNKHGSAVPEGDFGFFLIETQPRRLSGLGYFQKKTPLALNRY